MSFFSKLKETVSKIVDKVIDPTKQFEKQARKFNEKIINTKESRPSISEIQPQPLTIQDIEEIKTSPLEDIKSKTKQLKNYNKKGKENPVTSKTGNTVTEWELETVASMVEQINREREKEREEASKLEVTTRGQQTGMTRGEMGSVRLNELNPKTFNFDKIKAGKEWQKFVESVEKQASTKYRQELLDQYKENYLKALDNAHGEHAKQLKEIVKSIPSRTLYEQGMAEQEAWIDFVYDPQERQLILDVLTETWQGVYDNLSDSSNG